MKKEIICNLIVKENLEKCASALEFKQARNGLCLKHLQDKKARCKNYEFEEEFFGIC